MMDEDERSNEDFEYSVKELAEELGDEKSIEYIESCLLDGNINGAKIYMLRFIDEHYEDGKMTHDTAAELYRRLGIGMEEAARLRQRYQK